jgi:hypothetical protein
MKKKIRADKTKQLPACAASSLINKKKVPPLSLKKLSDKTVFRCALSDIVVR